MAFVRSAIMGLVAMTTGFFLHLFGGAPPVQQLVLPPADTSHASVTAPSAPTTEHTTVLDIHALPLGDGKISTSPQRGYVYACKTTFRTGGASHDGSWIHGSTWDLGQKLAVEGSVSWPNAVFNITRSDSARLIVGNALPVDTTTGVFPIAQDDPAYAIDKNPNTIKAQDISFGLPLTPQPAVMTSCLPMGMIGVALNGVPIFSALDDAGRDAVAHEVQDACSGHPQGDGVYHYHGPSPCMPHADENDALVGYALDGYGIYSRFDASGKELTNEDLDACHGTTTPIVWDGKVVTMYHYVLTNEYPYTLGCFLGTPVHMPLTASGAQPRQSPPGLRSRP